jgi:hypothetical protein
MKTCNGSNAIKDALSAFLHQARIAEGTIHPGLERRPAVEMIESYFSSLPKRRTRLNASAR